MPIYEFKCGQCEAVSSFSMKMSDPHPTTCPTCNEAALKKIISSTSFVLKGGGWYADAYTKGCSSTSESSSATTSSGESSSSKAATSPSCACCPSAD
jgi:putative FmdB family regulatory protein